MDATIQVDEFPSCCKAYILHGFLRDHDSYYKRIYSDSGMFLRQELTTYTEEQIRIKTRDRLLDIIEDQWEYDELTLFAAVTQHQMIAKEELLRVGFKEVSHTINPESYDEVVYFMVKDLREGEDWYREEDEEDYD